jgi:hypothetical protein
VGVLCFFVVLEPGGLLSFEDVIVLTHFVDTALQGEDFPALIALLGLNDLHEGFAE